MSTAGAQTGVDNVSTQRWVGVKEVAQYLGVTAGFVYKHKLQIPHVKVGKYLRFDLQQVRSALKSSG